MGLWDTLADQLEAATAEPKPLWTPTPKQQACIDAADSAFETLYGGAAGGGKSHYISHDAAQYATDHPGAHIGIVRKTLPMLKQTHLLTLRPLLHDLAKHNSTEGTWTFPNGSIIRFISLSVAGAEQDYKSVEFDRLYFDEVTELTEPVYTYMLTRLRSKHGHKVAAISASNPEGVGFRWVKNRWVTPPKVARPTPGQVWHPSLHNGEPGPARVFVPATVHDNPHLLAANPEYVRQLEAIPDPRKRAALLYGDWAAMDQIPGALFDLTNIEANRAEAPETLTRTVVAIDPAVTFTDTSDEFGIIAAGKGPDGRVHILADKSGRFGSPDAAMQAVVAAAEKYDADAIVYEANQGHDFIKSGLKHAGAGNRKIVPVHAKRGKALRAEPVSVAYSQGKVAHALKGLTVLEEQLTTWTPETVKSPDRLDALVYAVAHLLGTTQRAAVPILDAW